MSELYEPRLLGLTPERTRDTLEARTARLGAGPITWESAKDGGLERVAARAGEGAYVWWLDPARNWNPVRMQVVVDDKPIAEIVIELRDHGNGHWFPRRVEEFSFVDGSRTPHRTVDVRYAAFNRPGQPARFTPADIGIEVGARLDMRDREPIEILVWDGAQTVSQSEFGERLERGEVEFGPTIRREGARLDVLTRKHDRFQLLKQQLANLAIEVRPIAAELDAWERYTQDFIKRHRLDPGQQERALSVLKDCKNEAESILNRKRPDIDALEKRRERMERARVSTLDEWRRLHADRQRLIEPLGQIFEDRLKPRLDDLLTSEQRARAATTRPAP